MLRKLLVSIFILLLGCSAFGQKKEVQDPQNLYPITVKDKSGFIDSKGNVVIAPTYVSTGYYFCEGLVSVLAPLPNTRNPAFGFIDTKGNLVIPYKFKFTGCFSEGLVSAILNASGQKGYFDKTGKIVFAHQYEEAQDFSQGLASVKRGNKYGYIDRSGKVVIPFQFSNAYDFKDGLAVVSVGEYPNTQFGMIDKAGKFFLSPQFDSLDSFSDGLAKVTVGGYQNSRVGFIDKSSNFVIRPQFEYAGNFSEGLAYIVNNQKYGFINKAGEIAIQPTFDGASDFREGLAPVQIGNNWGFINKTGELVIPAKFEQVQGFRNGLANVTGLDDTYYINKNGETVWEPGIKSNNYAGLTDDELNFMAGEMVKEEIIPEQCVLESEHPKRIFESASTLWISPGGVMGIQVYGKGCACLGARRCGIWLFMKTVDGYRLLADGGPTDGFETLKTITNGYYDVRASIPDSFLRGIYFTDFKFNGRKYEESKSGCIPIKPAKGEKLPPQCSDY